VSVHVSVSCCPALVLSVSSSTTCTRERTRRDAGQGREICVINHVLSRYDARPVPMVVQIVRSGGDGGALLHGHGARSSPRFRHAGCPGRRTLSTYIVAGATITTTPGPHRSDCRDRQLRQDGGMTIFRYQALLPLYIGCSRSRASGFEDLSVISASLNSLDGNTRPFVLILPAIARGWINSGNSFVSPRRSCHSASPAIVLNS